jgi:hypothetical protein
MLIICLAFRALRAPSVKALVELPELAAAEALPADTAAIRFTLMRALQGVRTLYLYRFGKSEASEQFMVGNRMLHPAVGKVLIRHGWVAAGQAMWAEAVAQYQLSPKGLALKNDLESWWATLTLGQRLRAALTE